MRYHEIVGRERFAEQNDLRKTLSLYVTDGEYADCAAMIRQQAGRVIGITKVPVGGRTLQVLCPTVDAAYDLFASWLDYMSRGPRRPCVVRVS